MKKFFAQYFERLAFVLVTGIGLYLLAGPADAQTGRGNPSGYVQGAATTVNVADTGCVTGSCAILSLGGYKSFSIQLTGTCGTCTANFEASNDGTNWQALNAAPSNSATPAASASAAGLWQGSGAFSQIRVRLSARSSGSFVVTLRAAL